MIEVLSPLPVLTLTRTVVAQILRNLLTNALKFVPDGTTPHIQIWVENSIGKIRIAIKDNGIGIEPQYHERIFRLFERLHSENEYPVQASDLLL